MFRVDLIRGRITIRKGHRDEDGKLIVPVPIIMVRLRRALPEEYREMLKQMRTTGVEEGPLVFHLAVVGHTQRQFLTVVARHLDPSSPTSVWVGNRTPRKGKGREEPEADDKGRVVNFMRDSSVVVRLPGPGSGHLRTFRKVERALKEVVAPNQAWWHLGYKSRKGVLEVVFTSPVRESDRARLIATIKACHQDV